MDDSRFDDIIRAKTEEAGKEVYDAAAWNDLQKQMANFRPSPWYVRYSKMLWGAAAVVAICLINGLVYYTLTTHHDNELQRLQSSLAAYTHTVSALKEELARESEQEVKTTASMKVLSQRLDLLIAQNSQLRHYASAAAGPGQFKSLQDQYQLLVARLASYQELMGEERHARQDLFAEIYVLQDSIHQLMSQARLSNELIGELSSEAGRQRVSGEVIDRLLALGVLEQKGQQLYLQSEAQLIPVSARGGTNAEEVMLLLDSAVAMQLLRTRANGGEPLSVAMQRDLEKHYMKGVGVRLGPSLETMHPLSEFGDQFGVNFGLGVDLWVSPSLSVETGISYLTTRRELPATTDISTLPNYDRGNGELLGVEVNSETIEIPLRIKYRYPINGGYAYTSLGPAAIWNHSQLFEYKQSLEIGERTVSVDNTSNAPVDQFLPGYVDIRLGLNKYIKKQNSIEVALFYKYSLTNEGVGNSADLLGLRTAYWFKVR